MTESLLDTLMEALPLHGGDIDAASARFGIPVEQWIDLSTGMNSEPYPIPDIPSHIFHKLPYSDKSFERAVRHYYEQEAFVTVPGSQFAIQVLPEILNRAGALNVLLPSVGYKEHAIQWGRHGNTVQCYRSDTQPNMRADIDAAIANEPNQHIVIIRPNNPTTISLERSQVITWCERLCDGAFIIVDEAFIDTEVNASLLNLGALPKNLIVLRSFGKFFGLAGLRLGFVFAHAPILEALSKTLGMWQINGPAQYIATKALLDNVWHKQAIQNIQQNSLKTESMFQPVIKRFCIEPALKSDLFLVMAMPPQCALRLNYLLAKAGILTRVVTIDESKALLRVGNISCKDEPACIRIDKALKEICDHKTEWCLNHE